MNHLRWFKSALLLVICLVCFFLAAYRTSLPVPGLTAHSDTPDRIQSGLHKAYSEFRNLLSEVTGISEDFKAPSRLFEHYRKNQEHLHHSGFHYLIYQGDSLIFWSDSEIAFENIQPDDFVNHTLVKLRNGWYVVFKESKNNTHTLGFLLIQTDFNYQNKYLKNKFNRILDIPVRAELSNLFATGSIPFAGPDGDSIFWLKLPDDTGIADSTLSHILYALSVLFFILFVRKTGSVLFTSKASTLFKLPWVLAIVCIMLLSLAFQWPGAFYDLQIFNPRHYAGSVILSSLGNFIMITVLAYYLVTVMYSKLVHWRRSDYVLSKIWINIAWDTVMAVVFLASALMVNFLLHNLIINSSISFNVNNVFTLNLYSVYSFILIGILLFLLFLIADIAVSGLNVQYKDQLRVFIPVSLASTLLMFVLISYPGASLFVPFNLFVFSWALLFYFALYLLRKERYNFADFLVIISLLALFAGYSVSRFTSERERSSRLILAQKLEKEQDHIAEHLFEDIEKRIAADRFLGALLLSPQINLQEIEKRVKQLYFTGFWIKYENEVYVYDSLGISHSSPGGDSLTLEDIREIAEDFGLPTFSPNFYFISNTEGRVRYLGIIPVSDTVARNSPTGFIVIDLQSRLVQDVRGYPELLLSFKVSLDNELRGYSYARYQKGKLISQNGKFPYYLSASVFGLKKDHFRFAELDGYDHLIYRIKKGSIVVLSKEKEDWFSFVTLFSYLFAFFWVLILLFFLAGWIPVMISKRELNFTTRIQWAMIFLVLISLLLIGGSTVFYIYTRYDEQKTEQISSRISTTLFEIEKDLVADDGELVSTWDDASVRLGKLSGVLDTDFNIYDYMGRLRYSTQPKIFEQGIISRRMDPVALGQLITGARSRFIQDEHIGTLGYTAAYETIRNDKNEVLGFLNLPYFARQSELKEEIASFLVTLLNVYVLLFAIAVLLAVMVAGQLTRPLLMIREQLARLSLSDSNKPIPWKGNDEIGELVAEYNRMVDELAESAEKLARSERESAWREMAKQVAHEIKNPLTPMKLSVQHLQRLWANTQGVDGERVKRIAKTLEEQIDSLADIATEFSDFAKMPSGSVGAYDLESVALEVAALYAHSDHVVVTFFSNQKPAFVKADKRQLGRALSNLVKNAIQSVPKGQEGWVDLMIEPGEEEHVLVVSDNGTGIEPAKGDRIFEPNFTTKSGGMGLGLPMVKNIVEGFGGRVWFESKNQDLEGTRFFIALPAIKNPLPGK